MIVGLVDEIHKVLIACINPIRIQCKVNIMSY